MEREAIYELYCSRDLAERLGAISPLTVDHHRRLRDAGHMLLRDPRTGWATFWPWVQNPLTRASSG